GHQHTREAHLEATAKPLREIEALELDIHVAELAPERQPVASDEPRRGGDEVLLEEALEARQRGVAIAVGHARGLGERLTRPRPAVELPAQDHRRHLDDPGLFVSSAQFASESSIA